MRSDHRLSFPGLLALCAIALAVGCDRQRESAGPATAPATQQALALPASPPATAPAATQPAVSFIWIDQQPYRFPPAKLILRGMKDQQMSALLFSDDPPDAIDDNYAGNSYYLEMVPELAPDAETLAGAVWDFKAPNSEHVDTVSGIYLEGRRRHLQPFDVHVEFVGEASPMTVLMSGTFLQFDNEADPETPAKLVMVRAELTAEVRLKPAGK